MPLSHRRAFVAHHTRLRPVPGVDGIRLHLADDAVPIWQASEAATGVAGAPIPFWAFAWSGGLALVRYLEDHREEVRDKVVLDFATGSGLVGIVAARLGASHVIAADIDPLAEAAAVMNAKANGAKLEFVGRDLLDEEPPDVDVVLAGDTWYEGRLATRVLPWLRRARDAGIDVLVGDPKRHYLPTAELVELARYDVRTTTELEDLDQKVGYVYRLA